MYILGVIICCATPELLFITDILYFNTLVYNDSYIYAVNLWPTNMVIITLNRHYLKIMHNYIINCMWSEFVNNMVTCVICSKPNKLENTTNSSKLTKKGRIVKAIQDDNNCKLLWSVSFHFPKPPTMWSGCMQLIQSGSLHLAKTSDSFLPLIDSKPSDPICVRVIVEYVSDYVCRHGIPPVLTLDQQLWLDCVHDYWRSTYWKCTSSDCSDLI